MKQIHKHIFIMVVFVLLLASCSQPGGDSTGSEFMPDMAHSVAYEANYYNYYYNNTWGSEEDYYEYAKPRVPVKGTVSRRKSSTISISSAGDNTPYYYGNTEDERTRATNELVNNPHPITDAGLAVGKELYNINCAICHGEKGDGNGYLLRDDGGKYPVQPANLISDEFTAASNGRFYHSIMYGKNLMGGYSDKLAYGERWEVIHYIRSLQAKEKKLVYNQSENTLNNTDKPAGTMQQLAEHIGDNHGHDGNSHDGHSHDAAIDKEKTHEDGKHHEGAHKDDHHGDNTNHDNH